MKSSKEVLKALKACHKTSCDDCSYGPDMDCDAALMKDAARLIARLELENAALKSSEGAKPLRYWAEHIHMNAVEHGWWDEERSFGEIVALCHSELSEALEEYRSGREMVWYACTEDDPPTPCDQERANNCCYYIRFGKCPFKEAKPEGIAVEMIDCLIRILDWCGKEGVDVDELLAKKHEYNKGRPYRHGGKVI